MSVVIETTLGDITVDLFLTDRPVASMNFLKLCKIKYYNLNLFHTVSRGFIAQTGDPTGSRNGGESIHGILGGTSKRYVKAESNPTIKHTKMGLISFVCNDDFMMGSQFFFTLGDDLTYLDKKHCVFGEVVEGLDVLEQINEAICCTEERPYQDIRITHTVILDDPLPDPPKMKIPPRSPCPSAERLQGGRIPADEEIDETAGKSMEQINEAIAEREAKARATILEMVGDLPDAEMAPPENVLFVCKLNPVTTDDDLEIIFSRFGKIKSCEVIRDHKSGDSLQYAFIEFEEQKACEDAYFKMDNVLIDDRRIHVDFSQSVSKMKWHGKGRGVTHYDDKGNRIKESRHCENGKRASGKSHSSHTENTEKSNRHLNKSSKRSRSRSSSTEVQNKSSRDQRVSLKCESRSKSTREHSRSSSLSRRSVERSKHRIKSRPSRSPRHEARSRRREHAKSVPEFTRSRNERKCSGSPSYQGRTKGKPDSENNKRRDRRLSSKSPSYDSKRRIRMEDSVSATSRDRNRKDSSPVSATRRDRNRKDSSLSPVHHKGQSPVRNQMKRMKGLVSSSNRRESSSSPDCTTFSKDRGDSNRDSERFITESARNKHKYREDTKSSSSRKSQTFDMEPRPNDQRERSDGNKYDRDTGHSKSRLTNKKHTIIYEKMNRSHSDVSSEDEKQKERRYGRYEEIVSSKRYEESFECRRQHDTAGDRKQDRSYKEYKTQRKKKYSRSSSPEIEKYKREKIEVSHKDSDSSSESSDSNKNYKLEKYKRSLRNVNNSDRHIARENKMYSRHQSSGGSTAAKKGGRDLRKKYQDSSDSELENNRQKYRKHEDGVSEEEMRKKRNKCRKKQSSDSSSELDEKAMRRKLLEHKKAKKKRSYSSSS